MGNVNRLAAQYIRMSTELQRYSLSNQQIAIEQYAEAHRLEIVQTYADGGRSGLGLRGRDALQQLLADVTSGQAPYDTILVYDVSRWGRFQDTDESAHYEFICRRAGKRVIYCAEPFDNDGSPMTAIVKGLKRVMAGEYSRELSVKVFEGQSRLAMRGFHVGGRACYGMRRMIIDANGQPRGVLEFGQRKAMQRDRIVLIHGPAEEVAAVRNVFSWFLNERLTYLDIAERLAAQQVPPPVGKLSWNRTLVRGMLGNEKYTGSMVYNRTTSRLSTPKKRNPPSAWIRVMAAFEPIIDSATFEAVQKKIEANPRKYPTDLLAQYLRSVLQIKGRLSSTLLRNLHGGPAPETMRHHFGSMYKAFEAIGYDQLNDSHPASRRWQTTRTILDSSILWLIECLQNRGLTAVRTSLRGIKIDDSFLTYVTVPWYSTQHKAFQIALHKTADAVVVTDLNLQNTPFHWAVCDPVVHRWRTLILQSDRQFEKMQPWLCDKNEVVNRLVSLYFHRS